MKVGPQLTLWQQILIGLSQHNFDNLERFIAKQLKLRLGRKGGFISIDNNLFCSYNASTKSVLDAKGQNALAIYLHYMNISDIGGKSKMGAKLDYSLFVFDGVDLGEHRDIVLEKPLFHYIRYGNKSEMTLIGFAKNRANNEGPIYADEVK